MITIELTNAIEINEISTKDPAQKIVNATTHFIKRSVQVKAWGNIFLEAYEEIPMIKKEVSRYLIRDIKNGIKKKLFKIKYDDFIVEQINVLILHAIRIQLKTGQDIKITNKTSNSILQLLNYQR